MIKKLTRFEYDVVKIILEKYKSEYLPHLDGLKVISRDHTGCGQFINFNDHSKEKEEDLTLSNKVYADVNDLPHGVGFLLYIKSEKIVCLEIFSYGDEDLPETIESYEIKILNY